MKPLTVAAIVLCLATSVPFPTGATSSDSQSIVSNQLDLSFAVSEPETETPSDPVPAAPAKTEQITVVVDGGSTGGGSISTAVINRTTNTDGTKKDVVTYTPDKAQETLDKAVQNGQSTARIVIPDSKDEVSEVNVNIPRETLQKLSGGSMNLEIYTENARIVLPNDSMSDLNDDLYFRVVPIKEVTERNQVEERAKKEEVVRRALGDGGVQIVGRPATIETNISSRPVDLVLPLRDVTLPTDAAEREKLLADLVIFIEHSDGERELVKPEPTTYKDGELGLKFSISKFSTFTILNMENWAEYSSSLQKQSHSSYMEGYPDGTFRPDRGISRAEMAALLSRVGADKATGAATVRYSDLPSDHWAYQAVMSAGASGLMDGYPDGTFAPEQAVTRAEMAAIVSRWLSLTGEAQTTGLSDIQDHWGSKQMTLVEQAGILHGMPDGTFQPDRPLTRAEAVTVINRILKRGPIQGELSLPWQDVAADYWAFGDILEASVPHSFTLGAAGEEQVTQK